MRKLKSNAFSTCAQNTACLASRGVCCLSCNCLRRFVVCIHMFFLKSNPFSLTSYHTISVFSVPCEDRKAALPSVCVRRTKRQRSVNGKQDVRTTSRPGLVLGHNESLGHQAFHALRETFPEHNCKECINPEPKTPSHPHRPKTHLVDRECMQYIWPSFGVKAHQTPRDKSFQNTSKPPTCSVTKSTAKMNISKSFPAASIRLLASPNFSLASTNFRRWYSVKASVCFFVASLKIEVLACAPLLEVTSSNTVVEPALPFTATLSMGLAVMDSQNETEHCFPLA